MTATLTTATSFELTEALADPHATGTDWAWDLVDRVGDILEAAPVAGLTRSQVGRKAGCDTTIAGAALNYLVAHQLAHTSGNGAWTHFHPGRVR